jgi:hypothetical protein
LRRAHHFVLGLQWWARFALPYKAASLHAQGRNEAAAATKQPDGQITQNLSSPSNKNIPLNLSGKSVL